MGIANKYISEAFFVTAFNLDKNIRFKQPEAEEAFRTLFPVQSSQTNLPDDFDPQAARLLFQTKHKTLVISQVAAQLKFSFELNDKLIQNSIEIIRKNVTDFFNRLLLFKDRNELKENAIIVAVNYPSTEDRQFMVDRLYRHFMKVEPLSEIASFTFSAGFKTEDDHFLNLEPMVYELRKGDFQIPATGALDISNIPVAEVGYGLKIDINNRPAVNLNSYSNCGPNQILDHATKFITEKADAYMGF